MSETSSLQRLADDVMGTGDQALGSGLLDGIQTKRISDSTNRLNRRWNALNIDVLQREMRLDATIQIVFSRILCRFFILTRASLTGFYRVFCREIRANIHASPFSSDSRTCCQFEQ